MNYQLVLQMLYSGKEWVLTGNSYDGLNWLDASPKPADAELIAAYPAAQAKETAQVEISKLKAKLVETDYVVLPDYDQEKPDVIAQRQQWRERIRELEAI